MRSTRQTRMICRKPFSLVDLASAFALPELGLARWEVLPGPDHGRAPRAASSERLPFPDLGQGSPPLEDWLTLPAYADSQEVTHDA